MAGKVLTGNGITRHGNGAYSLIGRELTEADRELIDQRLEALVADGDPGLDTDAVLDDLH